MTVAELFSSGPITIELLETGPEVTLRIGAPEYIKILGGEPG